MTELDQRHRTDYPEGFGELELAGDAVRPANCAQWTALRGRGFEPTTTLEAQGNNFAIIRCGALVLLKRARPSSVSYVREIPADRRLLAILPAAVASGLDAAREQARNQAGLAGRNLREFDAEATLTRAGRRKDGFEIAESGAGGLTLLNFEIWGDLNGDGIEDLALSVVNTDPENGDAEARLILVSRSSSNEALRLIE